MGRLGCAAGRRAHPLPDRSLELLAWQYLVGAWPISADRLAGYLGKAAKEAKLVTSHVDAERRGRRGDRGVARAGARPTPDRGARSTAFVARIDAPAGWSNSLGQKLLQLTGPGVPDVYQGTELFEYSLVDPDNRRPVDFDAAPRAAGAARRRLAADVDADCPAGAAKLLVTPRRCGCAGTGPSCSPATGRCRPTGPAADARGRVRAVGRRSSRWPPGCRCGWPPRGGWGDTVLPLPAGPPTGPTCSPAARRRLRAPRLAQLLDRYPVALLVRSD